MAFLLEALSSNDLFNIFLKDTIPSTPCSHHHHHHHHQQHSNTTSLQATTTTTNNFLFENGILRRTHHHHQDHGSTSDGRSGSSSVMMQRRRHHPHCSKGPEAAVMATDRQKWAVQGEPKRRRRRARVCKNKEEAETQRMTHIAIERNRRRQMKEHLAVLRSLMPDTYVQRVSTLTLPLINDCTLIYLIFLCRLINQSRKIHTHIYIYVRKIMSILLEVT